MPRPSRDPTSSVNSIQTLTRTVKHIVRIELITISAKQTLKDLPQQWSLKAQSECVKGQLKPTSSDILNCMEMETVSYNQMKDIYLADGIEVTKTSTFGMYRSVGAAVRKVRVNHRERRLLARRNPNGRDPRDPPLGITRGGS